MRKALAFVLCLGLLIAGCTSTKDPAPSARRPVQRAKRIPGSIETAIWAAVASGDPVRPSD